MLIIQGERDPNATPEDAPAVREAMHRGDVAYEVLALPDEGRGIARPASQRMRFARLAGFSDAAFRQRKTGRLAPAGPFVEAWTPAYSVSIVTSAVIPWRIGRSG